MLLSLMLLLVTTGGFIVAIWGVFVGFFLLARQPLSTAMVISTVPTFALLLWILVLEYRGSETIERAATATPDRPTNILNFTPP